MPDIGMTRRDFCVAAAAAASCLPASSALAQAAKYPARTTKLVIPMRFDPVAYGSREFARMMDIERPQWAAVIKSAGIATKKK